MEFFHKNQKLILVIVLLGGAFYAYVTFFKSDAIALAPQDSQAEQVGGRVLTLYENLKSVRLDPSLFNYSLYKNLIDFSTVIPDQPLGRRNPFNVIGQE